MKISSSSSRVSSCGVRAAWLRRVLSCGVALGALSAGAAGAQAGELDTLKAQIEALQSRVNQIEVAPPEASAKYPEGASYMTFRRGSDIYEVDGPVGEQFPSDRGFTIAITPTADLPAPVMEVSVGGYVKADFIYDTHNDLGKSASPGNIAIGGGDDENFQAHAQQSRFRIKSRSDTSVGEIRTLIEGDFEGSGSGTTAFRLRHAWGEWDLTPDLTLGAGQSWATKYHGVGETPTVDFSGNAGSSGFNGSRVTQIQLRGNSGPSSWAVGLQSPRCQLNSDVCDKQLPDLAAKVNFDLGGAQVGISGVVREVHIDRNGEFNKALMTNVGVNVGNDSEVGYGMAAGVDLPLGDIITLHGFIGYGDGAEDMTGTNFGSFIDGGTGKIATVESFGFGIGGSLHLSNTSTINAVYSHAELLDDVILVNSSGSNERFSKVHVNYMWQPVSKLRMGLEGIYAEREDLRGNEDDNLRLQFGTWFFF